MKKQAALNISSIALKSFEITNEGIEELIKKKGFKKMGEVFYPPEQIVLMSDPLRKAWFKVNRLSGAQIVACRIKEEVTVTKEYIIFRGTHEGINWQVKCLHGELSARGRQESTVRILDESDPEDSAVIETPAKIAIPANTPAQEIKKPTITAQLPISLETCEGIIRNGLDAFVQTGHALSMIETGHLYKEASFDSFASYYQARWGGSLTQARALIRQSNTYEQIKKEVTSGQLPTTQAQLRMLSSLAPEAATASWKLVQKKAGGIVVTDELVRTVTMGQQAPTKETPHTKRFTSFCQQLERGIGLVTSRAAKKAIKSLLRSKPEAEVREIIAGLMEDATKLMGFVAELQKVQGVKIKPKAEVSKIRKEVKSAKSRVHSRKGNLTYHKAPKATTS
ncbi:MAG: hypothetical protein EXS50_00380 [Candidatus Taylorbacteria bacterium]|nr:hypothetical protein [Candidatus Taylorbacteria bacterium]